MMSTQSATASPQVCDQPGHRPLPGLGQEWGLRTATEEVQRGWRPLLLRSEVGRGQVKAPKSNKVRNGLNSVVWRASMLSITLTAYGVASLLRTLTPNLSRLPAYFAPAPACLQPAHSLV